MLRISNVFLQERCAKGRQTLVDGVLRLEKGPEEENAAAGLNELLERFLRTLGYFVRLVKDDNRHMIFLQFLPR